MKQILLLLSLTATASLPSCSAIQGVSGRVVTKEGELAVQPDGRIDITVHPAK